MSQDQSGPARPVLDLGTAILVAAVLRNSPNATAFAAVQTYREIEDALAKIPPLEPMSQKARTTATEEQRTPRPFR